MLMMVPPLGCPRISSAATHEAAIVPLRSTSRSASSFSEPILVRRLAGQNVGTGVIDPDINPAETVSNRADQFRQVFIIGDVHLQRDTLPPQRFDLRDDLVGSVPVGAVGRRDIGTGRGTGQRDCPSDPARRPGHDDDLVAQQQVRAGAGLSGAMGVVTYRALRRRTREAR